MARRRWNREEQVKQLDIGVQLASFGDEAVRRGKTLTDEVWELRKDRAADVLRAKGVEEHEITRILATAVAGGAGLRKMAGTSSSVKDALERRSVGCSSRGRV
jgi:hypothetical protein